MSGGPGRSCGPGRFCGLQRLLAAEHRRQRGRLLAAGASAATVAVASVLLLGVSGWFITGAALAGAAGAASAMAFNILLPSACIRLLAISTLPILTGLSWSRPSVTARSRRPR